MHGVIFPELRKYGDDRLGASAWDKDESWKTLDVIEHTEETIHKVVRVRNPGAAPPELSCACPSKDAVVITYVSPRRMCAIAKGIAKGLAAHYSESVRVSDNACTLEGAPQCQISIRTV